MTKIRRRRLNYWRRRGNLEFRRETKRLSDGTPWGNGAETLFIRIRGKACVFVGTDPGTGPGKGTYANDGVYFKVTNPVQAARQLRTALYRKANGETWKG